MIVSSLRVSIVVLCYNYAEFVGDAISSALEQSYANVEVIVVDDGSTDISATVIRQYGDRVRYLWQENQGHVHALNRGFSETSGAIVLFLDADDRLEPTVVAEVVRIWRKECAKVQYDVGIIDGDGRSLGRKFCNFPNDYDARRVERDFYRYSTYRWPVTVGNAYARSFLVKIFPLYIKHSPDGHLNTIAPLYGEILTVPRVLGYYRIHGTNLWSPAGSDIGRLAERIEDRYLEIAFLKKHALLVDKHLSDVNPLDHDLAFVNYRLIAIKLRVAYLGYEKDNAARLWFLGVNILLREGLPIKFKIINLVWLSVVSLSSPAAVRILWAVRFNRAAYKKRLLSAARLPTILRHKFVHRMSSNGS